MRMCYTMEECETPRTMRSGKWTDPWYSVTFELSPELRPSHTDDNTGIRLCCGEYSRPALQSPQER